MLKTLKSLFRDDHGFIVSIELVLNATIGVLSLIVGLSCLSNAIVAEYQDLGWAVRGLNQSYYFGGFRGCKSFVPGSALPADGPVTCPTARSCVVRWAWRSGTTRMGGCA